MKRNDNHYEVVVVISGAKKINDSELSKKVAIACGDIATELKAKQFMTYSLTVKK